MVLRICFDKNTLDFLYFFESGKVRDNENAYCFDIPDVSHMNCYKCILIDDIPTLVLDDIKVNEVEQERLEAKYQTMRNTRNLLLKETDFVLLTDSPFDEQKKGEYILYRQALRDLPSSIVDIDNINWPVKPE